MSKENSIMEQIYFVFGRVIVWILILVIPFTLGWQMKAQNIDYGKCAQTQIRLMPEEPCEYKKGDLYFKGSCYDVSNLIQIEQRRIQFEKEMENRINKFESNCKEFVTKNLYNNLREHEVTYKDFEDVTLEEFKKGEDVQLIINMSCKK